jgi:hypothetical protein
VIRNATYKVVPQEALEPVLFGPSVFRLTFTMQQRLAQVLCNIGFGARADLFIFIERKGKR